MATQLGKYILDELIAIGGMAEIYRAHTESLGGVEKILAIKRLHEHYCSDRDFVDMLVNEARIAVQLNHKNIAQVFDLEQEASAYFIAMEYIHGRDLHRVVRRFVERGQVMPIEAAVFIVQEICAGLSYAHRRTDATGQPLNIIHRDISPQNVLVSFEGEVKIVDFGIAKAAKRASLTHSGVIKGKFYYMSPEQARGDTIDQRADIFSVGAILFELVTGRMLYEGEDDARLIARVRRAEFQSPRAYFPDIPPRLERIIMKALHRDVHQRFQTARDMQLALSQLAQDQGRHFDSVVLSELMHGVFETGGDSASAVSQVAEDARMGRPDYQIGEHSLVSSSVQEGGGYGYGVPTGTDVRWPAPAPVTDDSETNVYERDEIQSIIDDIDTGRRQGGSRPRSNGHSLQRASLPNVQRPVSVDVDKQVYNAETQITATRPQRPGRRQRSPAPFSPREDKAPTTLFMLAVGGVILLAWAFVFATNQLVLSDRPEPSSGPRLQVATDQASGFQIKSDPDGASVWVDGNDSGQITPVALSGLEPGEHRVELKLIHHEDATRTAVVQDGTTLEVVMTPRRGILKVATSPSGAEVLLNGAPSGRSPVNIDGVVMRDTHSVAARMDGYVNAVKTVRWVGEEPILSVELTLMPDEIKHGWVVEGLLAGAGAVVAGAAKRGGPATGSRVAKPAVVQQPTEEAGASEASSGAERKVVRRAARRRGSESDEPASSGNKGVISVASKPPGELYIDGKPSGRTTPVRGLEVSPGYHNVKIYYSSSKSFSGEKRALVKPGAEVKLLFTQ